MKNPAAALLSRISVNITVAVAVVFTLGSSAQAGTVTFDGGGTNSVTLDTANNWNTNALPGTSDQVLFTDAGFGAALTTNATPQTWGNLIWDSNSTSTLSSSSSAGKITLSGGGGNADNDLITVGGNMTAGSLTWPLEVAENSPRRQAATSMWSMPVQP